MPRPPRLVVEPAAMGPRAAVFGAERLVRVEAEPDRDDGELRRAVRLVLTAGGSTSGITTWGSGGDAAGWAGLAWGVAAAGRAAGEAEATAGGAVGTAVSAAGGLGGVAMTGAWKRGSSTYQRTRTPV